MTQQLSNIRQRTARTRSAAEAGLPDPRPVTGYTVALTSVGANSRLTVTLAQPCVVRSPRWRLVNCITGTLTECPAPTVLSNTSFRYDFVGTLSPEIGFIDVPYMDTEVQNFQGGFVRPGGQWFRAPVGP
jgi:hypothetical protein